MTKVKIKPDLKKSQLVKCLGGRKASRLSCSVQSKVMKLSVIAAKLIKPLIYYQRKTLESQQEDCLTLEGGISFKSRKIARVMNTCECEEVVCFIATIGDGIERKSEKLLRENRLSEAYILDAIGSVAVENMVDKFHSEFITRTKMDSKGLTLRFSPGYCDWSIEDQKKLFNVFHSNHLEVQLRDSCFMSPRKSISGIFGIGPFHLDFSEHNPCLECSRVDCTMRRT